MICNICDKPMRMRLSQDLTSASCRCGNDDSGCFSAVPMYLGVLVKDGDSFHLFNDKMEMIASTVGSGSDRLRNSDLSRFVGFKGKKIRWEVFYCVAGDGYDIRFPE
jgi:hypothetical protein